MMEYNKPEFFVTEFTPNSSIAICPEESFTADSMVTVNCVISGTHSIFYDLCEEASEGADYDDLTIVNDFYTYTGQGNNKTYTQNDYLIWGKENASMDAGEYWATDNPTWAGGSENTAVRNSADESIIGALLNFVFGDNHNKKWMDYHAGVITPEVTSMRNSSF